MPKAKFLKPQADKIITLGKKETLQTTKMLVSKLQDIKSANKVKKTLSKRYQNRKGGYTRICLLYTSPSPRDKRQSRMPSSA